LFGENAWIILSSLTVFFVLSVSLSVVFAMVRGIAIVAADPASLNSFNSGYVYSQLGLAVAWIALSIVEGIISSRRYVLEAVAMLVSSVITIGWTIGAYWYGRVSIRKLHLLSQESAATSGIPVNSDVYSQRRERLLKYSRMLIISVVLGLLFVTVQVLDAAKAISTKSRINFNATGDAPRGFGDLLLGGLFELLKMLYCYLLLAGLKRIRGKQIPSEKSEVEEEIELKNDDAEEEGNNSKNEEDIGGSAILAAA